MNAQNIWTVLIIFTWMRKWEIPFPKTIPWALFYFTLHRQHFGNGTVRPTCDAHILSRSVAWSDREEKGEQNLSLGWGHFFVLECEGFLSMP